MIWICLSTTHVKELWQNMGWDPAACISVQDTELKTTLFLLAVLATVDMSLMHGMKQASIKCEHTVRAGAVILALPHFRCFGLPMLMLFTVVLSVLFAK